ncbi:lysophosphatidic acid phosphatase type 6 isoform X2 [Nerophis lumbriciformis]|nr:lysophosphatidic acid phosphatase type 6-like isoform X2 [Nerophis lumbriciformis]XP_061827150.1 lysophosphatidic acid phosphatase type 6-like isoform X2 [Nerophis lumbriciformis]XP_061827151.1 lysophosphatidic acid phosphatase type 6-like isoform X2 [Nerophis lumbriciformis]XP_061827152.1 lysophosphatidic acid phosphatase type 6-like isoform X2 [Nerophis lumbriciformis]XP_061827356.1 lysophosphatidic acid phosphatase type 6-like isoform X2 [Nerophis lumbriciformis]XP_061827358.1 lysophosph
MRKLWTKVGFFGSVSIALVSVMWWKRKNQSGDSKLYELKLVQVLFRHGARTPLKTIPDVMEVQWLPTLLEPPAHTHINYVVTDLQGGPRPPSMVEDSYRRRTLSGGVFPGQLTTLGMQQLYELGKRLRRRYIEESPFLGATFSPTEVYVRSTNIVRTIESAKCLVAGLFQQKQKDVVPIATTVAESEILYPNYHSCKLLQMLGSRRLAESSRLPDIAADLKSILSELGIADRSDVDFILIRDNMVARQAHGLPCPPVLNTRRSTVEQRAVDMMCHVYEPSKRESLQLCVGPLLHTILLNMEEKLQGASSQPNRKLFLYSAHDTTLIPCLMVLGIFDMQWPPYAADLTLELHQHQRTKEPFVKVSYNGQDQLIPGCSGLYCPLQEFKQVLSAYSLNSELYQTLCNNTTAT